MKFIDAIFSGSIFISGSFTPPKGTRDQRPTNPVTASVFFETSDSGSRLLIYNGSGSGGWQEVGLQDDPVPLPPPIPQADIEYLVVGGGAGLGGNDNGYYGGGGGAGGFLSSSLSSIESGSSIIVTVGAGSAAGNPSSNGNSSSLASSTGTSFTTVTALGGGGSQYISNNGNGSDGGSGGGAPGNDFAATGGSGTLGQGHDGGSHGAPSNASGAGAGSGGGGAGGPGQTRPSSGVGGNGGLPSGSTITGTTVYYAGGGGGGEGWSGFYSPVGKGTYGTNFTGGANSGGGGSYHNGNADAGDSGVVILAYPSSSIDAVGGIVGDAGNGRKYHQFNESGTFKVGSTSDFSIVTDSLALHLDAGDFASRGISTWTDLTGNGYNGTATNGASLSNGPYYTLDGTNDTIRFTENSNMINTSTMSIEMWVAVGNIGANFVQFLTNRSGTAGDNTTTMAFGIDNRQVVRTWNPSGTDYMVAYVHVGNSAGDTSAFAFKKDLFGTTNGDGNFHHIVGTFNSGTLKLYYDGVLQHTQSIFNSIWGGDEYYRIGGEYAPGDYTYNLTGDVGQMRFYHKELSAAEVLQNYNATKTNFI